MGLHFRSFAALAALLFACGGEGTPGPQGPSDRRTEVPPFPGDPGAAPAAPITSLKRARVKETIARGLGAFLQDVSVEDYPVMHEGKFHGFKIRTINAGWAVDLKPGDVVVRVNGIVPEHPEEADAALRSLEKAAALKVDFERDGKPRTLELPIVD